MLTEQHFQQAFMLHPHHHHLSFHNKEVFWFERGIFISITPNASVPAFYS